MNGSSENRQLKTGSALLTNGQRAVENLDVCGTVDVQP